MAKDYQAPELRLLGAMRDLTQQTHSGTFCDKLTCALGRGQRAASTELSPLTIS
jgi:hypothetical protein